jgi:ASC-1-like (ASCH) protein
MNDGLNKKPESGKPNHFEITLMGKYLNFIKSGQKKVEVRINSGQFKNVKIGDTIKFFNRTDEVTCEVTSTEVFKDFRTLLEKAGVENVIPGCKSIDEGNRLINSIPTFQERCKRNGCIALGIKVTSKRS